MELSDDEISEYRQLTSDLQQDLQQQIDADEELESALRDSWKTAQEKDRTGDNFSDWRDRYTDQVAVGWVLTSVFVRYLEDNGLVERWLAGSQSGGAADTVADNERWYFKQNPTDSEADYLLHIFGRLADMPAGELFGGERNPLYRLPISGDAAQELIDFFRATDADTGELHRDFSEAGSQTRFLGDLYQDLSTDARKRYALLQTPDFVEQFILEHTLTPALEDFGLFLDPEAERNEGDDRGFRFIDPTCGSGHFLLGGFRRILERLRDKYPSKPQSMLVRRALETVHGVDLNPFAVSISRFRLLAAAIHELDGDGPPELKSAPKLPLQVGVGDSLIHGSFFPRIDTDKTVNQRQLELDRFRWDDRFSTEDSDLIFGSRNGGSKDREAGILMQQYHAVVGNPPYIRPKGTKDEGPNSLYREFYASCHGKFSMVCPFYERFWQLGIDKGRSTYDAAGYIGAIVSNNFIKRSFGTALVEKIIPQTDLTHVIDTSGAYIPGHGTPTVMLLGRNQEPRLNEVRAALGIRGEPSTPDDPANAKVWSAIRDHIGSPGFENDFITIADKQRSLFEEHPWSLRGGGVLEAKSIVDDDSTERLGGLTAELGISAVTGEDDVFCRDSKLGLHRANVPRSKELVEGEIVRSWCLGQPTDTIWTYGSDMEVLSGPEGKKLKNMLWRFRARISRRKQFGTPMLQKGLEWFEWQEFYRNKFRNPLTITFAFVATHNHFVLDRGGKVFNRSAPVIKLPEEADEEAHLELLGPLNSSTGCFWMKQTFYGKEGGRVGAWDDRYEYAGTGMEEFPLPTQRPLAVPSRLDTLGQTLSQYRPQTIAKRELPDSENLEQAKNDRIETLRKMIPLQEELDWQMYGLYGLSEDPPMAEDFYGDEALDNLPKVKLGERAFEIVLARKMERGDVDTTWFERHGSTPRTDIPDRWPQWYQDLVQARIDRIDGNDDLRDRFVKLIEAPEFKRRWNLDDWEDLEEDALWNWMGNRLETPRYFPTTARMEENPAALEQAPEMGAESVEEDPKLRTVSELARIAAEDDAFQTVAARYTGDPSFDVDALVEELILEESVPHLPTQRHTNEGLRRRREWEEVWDLQRKEDETGEQIEDIPKPPRYRKTKDFKQKERIWPNRGKLDVPKERFTEYPGAARDDGEILVSWAGLNHKERARALAEHYYTAKDQWGWAQNEAKRPRLVELLAGLKDLLPWVKQWHPERLPSIDKSFGAFLEEMIQGEAVELGISLDEIEDVRIRSIDV